MFVLLLPAITAIVTGLGVLGDGGLCQVAGSGRLLSVTCGFESKPQVATGVFLPEPLVSWGLIILGLLLALWVVFYYWMRLSLRAP